MGDCGCSTSGSCNCGSSCTCANCPCPVCKSPIELEGPWDPVVAAADALHGRFTRASPLILLAGVSMGVHFSLQLYGALALWTFAGKEALMRFVLGPGLVIDGRPGSNVTFAKERICNALVMMNVAPALLFGRLLPGLSSKMFLPLASGYGMYHTLHEHDFLSWPPSPQLAIAVFPYIRSIYYNLWREVVLPYEIKFNRQLAGLPLVEERPERADNPDHGQHGEGPWLQRHISAHLALLSFMHLPLSLRCLVTLPCLFNCRLIETHD